ncbi:MAG TPA: hypothetical protein VGM24_00580 [Puia sp.]
MKKLGSLLVVTFALLQFAVAQQSGPPQGFDKSKLFFGGNFGLNFGTYTIINVSPQVGYHFTPQFAAGAGVNYIYYGYNDHYDLLKYTQSYAGLNVFGRFYPIQQFFIQAQPELNYVWGKIRYYGAEQSFTKIPTQFVPSLLLGGGAAIPAGRGAIMISVLYDVLQNTYSPYYHQALFGLGYNIGF